MTKYKGTGYYTSSGELVAWLSTGPLTSRPLVTSSSTPLPSNAKNVHALPGMIRAALANNSGRDIEVREATIEA